LRVGKTGDFPALDAASIPAGVTFTATFEEDRETIDTFKNEGLIAYRCVLSHEGRIIGIGRGLNVLSTENRYLSKSVKWAYSGALISAVSNAVKFPDLSGSPASNFGTTDNNLASSFMATGKQKDYLRELIDAKVTNEVEKEHLLSSLIAISKEDASELIGQLKS
jgi:hypothetical protein